MKDNKILFEVENFNVIQDLSDEQFATVEVYVCHDGNNKHNMPIKLSTIKRAAKTLKNKYLVAGFNGYDFEGHEPDEQIVGHFPESGKISYKKKDDKTYLVAEAVMSKVYANWAYEQFVDNNHRGVSMEISVTKMGDKKDNQTEIKEFVFNGVTILGEGHNPACEGADASIIKFSVENASEFYSKYSWKSNVIVRDFVDSMREETGKEGTEDMNETEKVIDEVITETSNTTDNVAVETEETVKVEPVFEDKEKADSDEDVIMEDDDDEEDEIDDDEEENQKKIDDDESDLDDKGEEVGMETHKEFASLTVEQKFQVFQAACKDKAIGWLESFDDEYLYVYSYDDGYTYRYSYSLDGVEVTVGDEKERVMRGGYVPFEASTEEGGTVTTEETVAEKSEATENVTSPEVEALQEEIAELKATITDYEEEKKSLEVESILSGVVDTLSPEQVSDLREEAKEFSLDKLSEFSNKVKALAFESVKSEGKYSFARVAFGTPSVNNDTTGKYSW